MTFPSIEMVLSPTLHTSASAAPSSCCQYFRKEFHETFLSASTSEIPLNPSNPISRHLDLRLSEDPALVPPACHNGSGELHKGGEILGVSSPAQWQGCC